MKTYYYDIDHARFLDSAGEWIPQCVPELFYQEHAEWKIALRDGGNTPVDFSRIAAWGAAVADDFRTDTAPMCRTQNEGIAADTNSGEVTVSLDCATEEFLACVTGASEKTVRFELYGLDSSGRRLINIGFDIRARMTLDPDPGIDVHTPDTVATKAFVSAYIHQSGAITSGAEIDTTVGEYRLTYTSSGGLMVSGGGVALQVSSGAIVASADSGNEDTPENVVLTVSSGGITADVFRNFVESLSGHVELTPDAVIASRASGESVVLSTGAVNLHLEDGDGEHQNVTLDTNGVSISAGGADRRVVISQGNAQIAVGDYGVLVNSRPVLTELATNTDSATTSASIEVLSGGTSYIYTQPLTSLSVASMESSMKETWLRFTVASGGSVSINDSGFVWFGGRPSAYEGGSSYSIGVWNGMIVCGELEE